MLEAQNLHKTYKTGAISLHVLKGVEFFISEGEFVSITGPSGAGKSTLLHLLAGLDMPSEGDVFWRGSSLSKMNDKQRADFRNNHIGVVFQFYHLLPELSALENVMLPGLVGRNGPKKKLKERALFCLNQVGLTQRSLHKPSELSGGELQRVAIARAILKKPKIIFCDEPTGNLDSQTGKEIVRLLVDLHEKEQASLVLVTHEQEFANLAMRQLVIRDGQFVAS